LELINKTPIVADVQISVDSVNDDGPRMGMLVAKATFLFDQNGTTELDTQNPFSLFATEEDTELGQLPSDAVQRRDQVFEVVLLGAAYPEGTGAVESMTVKLSVGDVSHTLRVTGDREWSDGSNPSITPPAPFSRMPLVYERTFGGMCPAQMDSDTVIDIRDSVNHHGRGFDARFLAKHIGENLRAPEGFPSMEYVRQLPNLEHPEHLIEAWDDAPEPYCWATVPQDIAFTQTRFLHYLESKVADDQIPGEEDEYSREVMTHVFHRAHPDWITTLPGYQALVTMSGMSPRGELSFRIPPLRVIADYELGNRVGTRELVPQLMVLLPEQQRFYIVYRASFTVETTPSMQRSFRLRTTPGWFQYPEPS
jgi:hypothetical protein